MVDTVEPVVGRTALSAAHRQLHEDTGLGLLNWVPSGYVVTAATGLTVDIAAGRAWLDGVHADRDVATLAVAVVASSTNHIFVYVDDILDDGVVYFHVDQDDTPPTQGPSTKLAEAVTNATIVTGVTDRRQLFPRVPNEVQVERPLATDFALGAIVGAEALARFGLRADGQMSWGDGVAARDVTMFRSAANLLKLAAGDSFQLDDGFFRAIRAATTSSSFAATVTGDAVNRLIVRADGEIQWGGGVGAADAILRRTGGSVMLWDDTRVDFTRPAATNLTQRHFVTGDTQPRLTIRADGRLDWGTGAIAVDLALLRLAAGRLGINDGATQLAAIGRTGTIFEVIETPELEFIVRDQAKAVTNIIWADPSANRLYLGTADYLPQMRGNVILDGNLQFGADVLLQRGGASVLELASGDNLNLINGAYRIAGVDVINSARDLVGLNQVAQNLDPNVGNTFDLGDATLNWRDLYIAGSIRWPDTDVGLVQATGNRLQTFALTNFNIQGGNLQFAGVGAITNARRWLGDFLPNLDITGHLGSAALRWNDLHLGGSILGMNAGETVDGVDVSDFDPSVSFRFFDDWVMAATASPSHDTFEGIVSSGGSFSGLDVQNGFIRIQTSTTINGRAFWVTGTTFATRTKKALWEASVRLSSGLLQAETTIGFNNGQQLYLPASTGGVVALFARDAAGAGTNWIAITNDGGADTGTQTDTGVAPVSGVFQTLRVEMDASEVRFFIDGTLEATHTTNLPPVGTAMYMTHGHKTTDAANKILDIDYTLLKADR